MVKTTTIGTPLGATGKTVFFGNAVMCRIEDKFEQPFGQTLDRMAREMDFRLIRTMLTFGLAKHHEGTTEEQAGEMIEQVGVVEAVKTIAAEVALAIKGGRTKAA